MMNICFKNELGGKNGQKSLRFKKAEAQSYMNFIKIFFKTVKRELLRVINQIRNRKEVTDIKAFNLHVHLFKMVCSKGHNSNSIIKQKVLEDYVLITSDTSLRFLKTSYVDLSLLPFLTRLVSLNERNVANQVQLDFQ